ncbi:MAG: type II toxin-antitoxin system HicA family toxin [Chloroflexota bacterium]|nr:type II toxin-antitoxin system HicA family toxin [Chloroflexota bacterium]
MTKRDKREQTIRRNPNQVRFDDLDTILQNNDFTRVEGAGSHIKYRHSRFPGIVTVSPHDTVVKAYQVKQAIEAIDTVRATEDAS